jgi:putative SOS response-associated peptidase YedK
MCNRYRQSLAWRELHEDFSQLKIPLRFPEAAPNIEPRLDVRPTNIAPIVRAIDAADPTAGVGLYNLRWDLVPFFHKGPLKAKKYLCTNCRSEEAATKPAFRESFKRRRCLVPANGFYEWTGEKGAKTKHLIEVVGERWFCMAGLWDRAETADGPIESFTIMTTAAGDDMSAIHDRQPVILAREDWGRWLDTASEVSDLFPARPAGHVTINLAPAEAA